MKRELDGLVNVSPETSGSPSSPAVQGKQPPPLLKLPIGVSWSSCLLLLGALAFVLAPIRAAHGGAQALRIDVDAYIAQDSPNTNYGSDDYLRIGVGQKRALVKADSISIPAGTYLQSALLGFNHGDVCWGWGTGSNVTVRRMVCDWYEDGVTWNSPGGLIEVCGDGEPNCECYGWLSGGSFATSSTDGTVLHSASVCSGQSPFLYDVTGHVRAFLTGALPNYGWIIVPPSPSFGTVSYKSSDLNEQWYEYDVYLYKEFTTTPPIVAGVSPTPNAAGWNKANAVVSFTCWNQPDISSCSSPVTVSTETSGQVVAGTATDIYGNSWNASATVKLDKTAPSLQVSSPMSGCVLAPTTVAVSGTVSDSLSGVASVTCNGSAATLNGGTFSCTVSLSAQDTQIQVQAKDVADNVATSNVSITQFVPSTVDLTVPTDIAEAASFIGGSGPCGQNADPGVIEPQRIAVLRGKVLERDSSSPISEVSVRVLGHEEYGAAETRLDGGYDIAVNGGDRVTLLFEKTGYPTAQRSVIAPWRDYVVLDDVLLVAQDSHSMPVDLLNNPTDLVVAQDEEETDADGTRQAVMMFQPGTTAVAHLPGGGTQPLPYLTVRATELTVGPVGPAAMPGPLPETSGYTYAINLRIDEAEALGATSVSFDPNHPVAFYLENFLGFPVGTSVPVGYYDEARAAWVPAKDGRTIKIVGEAGGLAVLDLDGDDVADDPTSLGITAEELEELALRYDPGQTLWRAALEHFSSYDLNWGIGPEDGAEEPNPEDPDNGDPEDRPDERCGCVIEAQNQTLGESVPIVGTPFSLHYRSDRVAGRTASRRLRIPLEDGSLPSVVNRVEVEVDIGGRHFDWSYLPGELDPNQIDVQEFLWDGLDAYGRTLQGRQSARVRIGYVYDGYYNRPPAWDFTFGFPTGLPVPGDIPARQAVTLRKDWHGHLGIWDVQKQALGGWSLDVHHTYDLNERVLYMGNGTRRSTKGFGHMIRTAAGTGTYGYGGDGSPASLALFKKPQGVAVGPDGSLYIADQENHRIRRVGPDGIISTFAGDGVGAYGGDGLAATSAHLNLPTGVAIASDGTVYIADYGNSRVRKVALDGTISTVAGNGTPGLGGDGGPATAAELRDPEKIAVAADGTLYISMGSLVANRVRRVAPDGVINTVAGTGTAGDGGDGGPATVAQLKSPSGLAVGPDGSVYIADRSNHRIRRVSPDGTITTVAGTGSAGSSGDGGLATSAQLSFPKDVVVAADGVLYIADDTNHRIRRVDQLGVITTVAGTGEVGDDGDAGMAVNARIDSPRSIAAAPNGDLYIADASRHRVRRLTLHLPGFSSGNVLVPAEDLSEIYEFDSQGRHLTTRHALTGAALYTFGYNAGGQLVTIVDDANNPTTIQRDGSGNPTAIVGPFGQTTTLELDPGGSGYLTRIIDPALQEHEFDYHPGTGLLSAYLDPNGNLQTFTYDSATGRLTRDDQPGGGFQTLGRAEEPAGFTVTAQTALGRTSTYRVEDLSYGAQHRTNTGPDELPAELLVDVAGSGAAEGPDGTSGAWTVSPDPRFGMQAPLQGSAQITTPEGKTLSLLHTRTAQFDPDNVLLLSSQTDTFVVNGKSWTSTFDALAQTVTGTSPEGRTSTLTLDSKGRVVRQEVPGITAVDATYDSRGRLDSIVQGNRVLDLVYDPNDPRGLLTEIVDPESNSVLFQYDAAEQVEAMTLPDDSVIGLTYDSNGNTTSVIPPGRPAHSFAYTARDQVDSYTAPPPSGSGPGDVTAWDYNLDGQPELISRPDSLTVDLQFELAPNSGRLSKLVHPLGSVLLSYDPNTGNIDTIQTRDPNDTLETLLTYTFDGALPRTEVWSGAVSGSVEHVYNGDLQLQTLRINVSNVTNDISLTYDDDGMLELAGALDVDTDPQNGLVTGTILGNVSDTLAYNEFGEIEEYQAVYQSSTLLDFQYDSASWATGWRRDKLGRIKHRVETVQSTTTTYDYVYDVRGRLDQVREGGVLVADYGYDANGNRTTYWTPGGTVTATYDERDRLLTYGDLEFTYTTNGELQTKTDFADPNQPETTVYEYDVLGNLRSVSLPDGTEIDYVIDGNSRRIGKRVDGTLEQQFLYDGQLDIVAELDAQGQLVIFVPGGMVKDGVTYRILRDHLGSPRLVVNASTGQVVQRMDYDEFGNVLVDTNPGFQPFGFAGGLWDADTGLVRFGARDFDPHAGRWTSMDPILFEGGDTNLFAYVGGDPVNLTDPTGLYWGLAGGVAGFGGSIAFQLYRNGGNWRCVNVWAAASWGLTASGLGILARGAVAGVGVNSGLGWRAYIWNPNYERFRGAYWRARGGAFNQWYGVGNLDHWLFTRAFIRMHPRLLGARGAGWNLFEIPRRLNELMGMRGWMSPLAQRALRIGVSSSVPGGIGVGLYGGYRIGTAGLQNPCGCN